MDKGEKHLEIAILGIIVAIIPVVIVAMLLVFPPQDHRISFPNVSEEHRIECQQCLKEYIPNITANDSVEFYAWLIMQDEEQYDADYIAGKWAVLGGCNCACLRHNCEEKS